MQLPNNSRFLETYEATRWLQTRRTQASEQDGPAAKSEAEMCDDILSKFHALHASEEEEEHIRQYTHYLIQRMADVCSMDLKESDLPDVMIVADADPNDGDSYFSEDRWTIRYGAYAIFSDQMGITVGEEAAHFLHALEQRRTNEQSTIHLKAFVEVFWRKLCGLLSINKERADVVTDQHDFPGDFRRIYLGEFIGFLGRRILLHAVQGTEHEKILFPTGKVEEASTRSETVHDLRSLRTFRRHFHEEGDETLEKIVSEKREEILTHDRPYRFAEKIDLTRIQKWQVLFAMPLVELQRRFFRADPDYSGL